MNLFETLGEMFRPQWDSIVLDDYKRKFYANWTILKHLTPQDDLFQAYIDLVDSELSYLKVEFNYIPFWEVEYQEFCDRYFDAMKFKVSDRSEFLKASNFTLNFN